MLPVTLLVDEDGGVRTPLAIALRRRGLQIVEASSTDEAHGLAQFGHVDVVIATLSTHEEGGCELCGRLRSTPATAHLPVVLLSTGEASSTSDVAPLAAAVVPRNEDIDGLVAVLRGAVARAGGTDSAT